MKRIGLILALMVASFAVNAQPQVNIEVRQLGSGSPGLVGFDNAYVWDNNIYHAPQYMPGYPTASVLWARVVDVECEKSGTQLNCKGYNWLPEFGRGEYLFIRPTFPEKKQIVPVVITNEVERKVYVEVPVKHKGE